MKCLSCGRKLKNTESLQTGYGPVCYKKLFGASKRIVSKASSDLAEKIPNYNIPGQMILEDFLHSDTEK